MSALIDNLNTTKAQMDLLPMIAKKALLGSKISDARTAGHLIVEALANTADKHKETAIVFFEAMIKWGCENPEVMEKFEEMITDFQMAIRNAK